MSQTNAQMQEGINRYNQPKPADDLDLVSEIRQRLVNANLTDLTNNFDIHPWINEAKGKYSDIQRFLINRYFNRILLDYPNSIQERFWLIPDGQVTHWLTLFDQKVLPFLVNNKPSASK